MKLEAVHELLAIGPDFETAKNQVLKFFDKTQLVRYDSVEILKEDSLSGADARFWERIAQGMGGNRQIINELIEDLKEIGAFSLSDAAELPQGFQSKTFHTIAHMLDGFFGIDSCFYNLVDDSHWLTDPLKQEILASPNEFWLIKVLGKFKALSPDKAALLRTFEPEP